MTFCRGFLKSAGGYTEALGALGQALPKTQMGQQVQSGLNQATQGLQRSANKALQNWSQGGTPPAAAKAAPAAAQAGRAAPGAPAPNVSLQDSSLKVNYRGVSGTLSPQGLEGQYGGFKAGLGSQGVRAEYNSPKGWGVQGTMAGGNKSVGAFYKGTF